jgi:parallel beta-helix repeat protein
MFKKVLPIVLLFCLLVSMVTPYPVFAEGETPDVPQEETTDGSTETNSSDQGGTIEDQPAEDGQSSEGTSEQDVNTHDEQESEEGAVADTAENSGVSQLSDDVTGAVEQDGSSTSESDCDSPECIENTDSSAESDEGENGQIETEPSGSSENESAPDAEQDQDQSATESEDENQAVQFTESTEDLRDIVGVISQTDSILIDEQGNPVPLASNEALEGLQAPDPWFVNSSGEVEAYLTDCTGWTPPDGYLGTCTVTSTPIQSAVDAAPAGSIVYVEDGVFREQVTINKDLTLQGAGAGKSIIQSPAGTLSNYYTLSGNKYYPIVFVQDADNVVVDGFTIDGMDNGNDNYRYVGVGYFNAGGAITNNEVTNIMNDPFSGAQHGLGIYVKNTDGQDREIEIDNNEVSDFQKNGITVDGEGINATITNNTILGEGPTDITAQNGIQLSRNATGTIENNTVDGVYYTGEGWASSGIMTYLPGEQVYVSNNTISNSQVAIYDLFSKLAHYEGNQIYGDVQDGIIVYSSDSAGVENNTINGASEVGIYIYDSSGIQLRNNQLINISNALGEAVAVFVTESYESSIYGNLITNNDIGVAVDTASDGTNIFGNFFTLNDTSVQTFEYINEESVSVKSNWDLPAEIYNNSFDGTGLAVDNQTSILVDASGNWWGTNESAGIQALISGLVDYSPWLYSNIDTDSSYPFSGDFSELGVDSNSPKVPEPLLGMIIGNIQEGINDADNGGTVHLSAGTYVIPAQIYISKDISVDGAGKEITILTPGFDSGSSGDARGWILVNAGNEFNLSNVTMDGNGRNIQQGIRSFGSGTIENNIFKNISYPTYYGIAIVMMGNESMTVSNNHFSNIGRIGMMAYGPGVTDAQLLNNIYVGKGDGDWLDYGIEFGGGAQGTAQGNDIQMCTGVASTDGSESAGILVTDYYGSGTSADILNNYITQNTYGVVVGYLPSDESLARMAYNSFSGNIIAGVYAEESNDVDVDDNWWGCNAGPGEPGCDAVMGDGTPVINAWLQYFLGATPSTISTGGSSTIAGPDMASTQGTVLPTLWWFSPGSVNLNNPELGALNNGVFTAGLAAGEAELESGYDGEIAFAYIIIQLAAEDGGDGGFVVIPVPVTGILPLPVTGGVFEIPCDTEDVRLRLANNNEVTFYGLCGYQAFLNDEFYSTLPEMEITEQQFISAFNAGLLKDAQNVEALNAGSVGISFVLPDGAKENEYGILYWVEGESPNEGVWVELPVEKIENSVVVAEKLLPDNELDSRMVIEGVSQTGSRLEAILNFSGIFALYKK